MSDRSLVEEVRKIIIENYRNNYVENPYVKCGMNFDGYVWSTDRIKEILHHPIESLLLFVKILIRKLGILLNNSLQILFPNVYARVRSKKYKKYEYLYDLFSDNYSRKRLAHVLAYRELGYHKYRIPFTPSFYESLEKIKKSQISSDVASAGFKGWNLLKFDLSAYGFDIKLFSINIAVYLLFVIKQYAYEHHGTVVKVEEGDIVLDAGGCWGDTALYFAHEVGEKGKVYCFEFMKTNLDILRKNMDLNAGLRSRVRVVEHPVWEKSGELLYIYENGPATTVSSTAKTLKDNKVRTLSIDDIVRREGLEWVDFIKMDIEGAELSALKGSINTIKKFRPKLAISLYHRLSDFDDIPRFINSLDVGYEYYLDHYLPIEGETILYAKTREKINKRI